jgi:hypothetical protein
MTDHLKKRWIFVVFCWMAAVFLTFWNLNTIESIEDAIEKKEIYLMDEQFWSHNAANISQILKKGASLIQEVESSKLGLFEFENSLRTLASNSGLKAVKLTSQSQSEQSGLIPVKISFQGTIRHAMNWLDILEIELPYALLRDVDVEFDEATRQNKFSVSMYYRYNQSAKEDTL